MGHTPQNLSAQQEPLPSLSREGRRRWIHPTTSKGRFHRVRLVVAVALIALFLGLPHLRMGGKPAFQIDLATRQLHLFGTTFFATDTLLLAVFGVAFVLFIALFTALFGRVWCGWACPQTVYLEFVFRPLEGLLEGPPGWRIRDENAPLTGRRLVRKIAKWALYVIIAAVLAHTFVAYFVGTHGLWEAMRQSPLESWPTFVAVLIVTALIVGDFAYFREQTCMIACPYGRLQSVLIDPNSLIVGYDNARGEPRRKLIDRGEGAEAGDCVDCVACVRTCPTGIDIRKGLQLECVGCTQCIDACDRIMDRVKKPRGLIRYTSLNQLEGKSAGLLRPRVIVYSVIMLAASAILVTLLVRRSSFEYDVVRRSGAPFYTQADGLVVNRIRLRITNRLDATQQFHLEVVSPAGAQLVTQQLPVEIASRGVMPVEALVRVPKDQFKAGSIDAVIRVVPVGGTPQDSRFVLLGPVGGSS